MDEAEEETVMDEEQDVRHRRPCPWCRESFPEWDNAQTAKQGRELIVRRGIRIVHRCAREVMDDGPAVEVW